MRELPHELSTLWDRTFHDVMLCNGELIEGVRGVIVDRDVGMRGIGVTSTCSRDISAFRHLFLGQKLLVVVCHVSKTKRNILNLLCAIEGWGGCEFQR